MIRIIYIIILTYFLLGGVGFYFINRKKEPEVARKSYTKFISYFFIINILFFSIVLYPPVFQYLALIIIAVGLLELFRLFQKSGYKNKIFYLSSTLVYILLSIGFFFFSGMEKELVLFSFLILSIFDSFSQINGQFWGKTKLFPKVSPNKTVGGLIGGSLFAIGSVFLLQSLYSESLLKILIIALGVVVFAFVGDIAASAYKRKFKVKDYNNLIPGHGGFLDRFDSLIAGGAWVTFCMFFLKI
jgi:phosphatidate cytidylyltransferase